MAQFEFRLQSVLNLREKIENQKELEYSQALKRLGEERAKERALVERKDASVLELSERLRGKSKHENGTEKKGINPSEVSRYNDFIELMKERITIQRKVVKAAEEFAEAKRKELVEAMRDRKTIERLRENALEEYKEEEKRSEQKQVDQLVSYKYAKN